jgi:arsenate reductase
MKVTIYHNPDCGTSRNALLAIRKTGCEPHLIEYLTTPMTRDAIVALAASIDLTVRTIVRRREPLFAELGLDEKDVTENELLDAMAANPILINRPIVVVERDGKTTGRLCRPSEMVRVLLAGASANA